ncbi:hypothetical protein D3C73_1271510 [compost metagenome]
MVVHGIGAELGFVQFRHIPAQRQPVLATVASVFVLCARQVNIIQCPGVNLSDRRGIAGYPWGQIQTGQYIAVITTLGDRVDAKKSAAVIDD